MTNHSTQRVEMPLISLSGQRQGRDCLRSLRCATIWSGASGSRANAAGITRWIHPGSRGIHTMRFEPDVAGINLPHLDRRRNRTLDDIRSYTT